MVTPLKINEKTYFLNHPPGPYIQNQINELARRKFYEVPIPEIGVVIDAGANVGAYSLYISEFAKKIYAIEPLKENYDYLVQNINENKKENIKSYRFALAGTNGRRVIYSSYYPEDKSGYSLLPVGKNMGTVETKTLATFMKEENIQVVHILKTDIEGLEQEVFSADDFGDVAPKILCITGEYHIQCQNLKEVLKYHGYEYSVTNRGMYIAIRKVKQNNILLPK